MDFGKRKDMKGSSNNCHMVKTIVFIRATGIYDDSRATKEIVAFAEAGYHVVVLGWDRNGEAELSSKKVFEQYNVDFVFFPCLIPQGIGLKNIGKLLKWFRWIKKELKKIPSIFAVHSCNLDAGIGSYRFCKKHQIKFAYDIYDYYIDSHRIPSFLKSFIEKKEIRLINGADLTIICTEERIEQISKAHPKKIIVVHNSPDVQDCSEVDEVYDYSYCGSLCDMRLVKEIVDDYQNNDDLRIAFAGNDKYKEEISLMSKRFANFIFLGTLPYSRVLEIESKSKVLSAIYEPTIRNHRLCAPNKFYESMALGKPIIVCRGTGIDKIVEKEGIGIVIEYSSFAFYEALRKLLASEKTRKEMGAKARIVYEKHYKWSIMKERLISAYEDNN